MPLYEYECKQCHNRVEKIQKFSDTPLTTCPSCSGELERTLTAPAVQFKGSGWYKDLYSSAKPSSGSSSGGDAGSSSAGATDGGSSSGSESKPTPAAPAPAAASAPATSASGSSGS